MERLGPFRHRFVTTLQLGRRRWATDGRVLKWIDENHLHHASIGPSPLGHGWLAGEQSLCSIFQLASIGPSPLGHGWTAVLESNAQKGISKVHCERLR